jgi:gamma-glutamyl hercynylcysteine S-oxide synthase
MPAPAEPLDPDPLKALFQQERLNVILQQKEQWKDHPEGEAICRQAAEYLDSHMAIIPEGRASLLRTLTEVPDAEVVDCPIDAFLLDIFAVSNARYQQFIDAGGYDDLSLWPESIWTHLIQMRDQTGQPGPRYWRDGRHDQRFGDHPVVGICWYEACAYTRWIGQRLPTEAEWQLAASWRIKSETDVLYRFPWGDAMDRRKCNIWAAGLGTTVPVNGYENGAAPNGVLQLVGNVWEWVDGDLDLVTEEGVQIVGEMTLKAARGGGFDTYFESQCTGLFRSGYTALTRAHNVGFRCALSLRDAHWLKKGG